MDMMDQNRLIFASAMERKEAFEEKEIEAKKRLSNTIKASLKSIDKAHEECNKSSVIVITSFVAMIISCIILYKMFSLGQFLSMVFVMISVAAFYKASDKMGVCNQNKKNADNLLKDIEVAARLLNEKKL